MRLGLVTLIVGALAPPAVADDTHVDLAIGVNPPIIWTYEREPVMYETRDVGRLQIDGEIFFRMGEAFSI